jgi:nucleoside-diphosphate-sugar epimerase
MVWTPPASRNESERSLSLSKPTDLSGRHIFLTGGTGFLGRTLLDYLSESAAISGPNFRVTVMSRTPAHFLRRWSRYQGLSWLTVSQGDLTHFPTPDQAVTDVIHAAADTHGVADHAQWIEQIAGGTCRALDWAASNCDNARFLLMSSGAVYGPQPADVSGLREDYTGAPTTTALGSVYGQAKRLAEQLCTVYGASRRLHTVIARCFAFTGPHVPLDGPYAIGNFIRDALMGDAIRVRGTGNAVRTYLYGRDAAHWLVTLLSSGVAGEAYNVGSDQPVTTAQLAASVAAILSPGKPVIVERSLADDGARSIYVPDISKAARLGLTVETPLNEAIRLSAAGVSEIRRA